MDPRGAHPLDCQEICHTSFEKLDTTEFLQKERKADLSHITCICVPRGNRVEVPARLVSLCRLDWSLTLPEADATIVAPYFFSVFSLQLR